MSRHLQSDRGFTLVELVTTIGILGLLLGAAMPYLNARSLRSNAAIDQFVADVRFARSKAIVSGVQICVHPVSSTRYQVRSMKLSGSSWIHDKTLRDVTLPAGTTLNLQTDQGNHLRFNTRGMQVAYANPNNIYPLNAIFGNPNYSSHLVTIWPSGQAYVEN